MKRLKYKWWFFVHNAVAHPLLILGFEWTDIFHDWTNNKMEYWLNYSESIPSEYLAGLNIEKPSIRVGIDISLPNIPQNVKIGVGFGSEKRWYQHKENSWIETTAP